MSKLVLLLVMSLAATACNKDKECPTTTTAEPTAVVEQPVATPAVVEETPVEKPVDANKPKKHKKYEGTKVPT